MQVKTLKTNPNLKHTVLVLQKSNADEFAVQCFPQAGVVLRFWLKCSRNMVDNCKMGSTDKNWKVDLEAISVAASLKNHKLCSILNLVPFQTSQNISPMHLREHQPQFHHSQTCCTFCPRTVLISHAT